MSARCFALILMSLPSVGCAWHYPVPVYPPFPPDHGYSAPYDPNQQMAAPVEDAMLLQQPAPPLTGS